MNEREWEIINRSKVLQFGARLQCFYLDCDSLIENPHLNGLEIFYREMDEQRIEFDITYLMVLPHEAVNPLLLEQEAWRLLSPKVQQQIDSFRQLISDGSRLPLSVDQLLTQLHAGWDLIQKWNVISESYKAKHQKFKQEEIVEKEQTLRKLIKELTQD